MLLDATGDPDPAAYTLYYRKVIAPSLTITTPVSIWSGSTASASFTVAAGDLIVYGNHQQDAVGTAPTNSGTAFAWTSRVYEADTPSSGFMQARIWTAVASVGQTMTVTAPSGPTASFSYLWVVSGQHASPIGVVGSDYQTVNGLTVNYTATMAGSVTFVVAQDYEERGTITSSDLSPSTTADLSGFTDAFAGRKLNTAAGATSFNLDPAGTTTPTGTVYVYIEVLPGPTDPAWLPVPVGAGGVSGSVGFPGSPGSAHELIRTSYGLSGSVTICGWYYHNAPRTFGTIFGLMNSTTSYDYAGFSTTSSMLYHITTGPETAGPTLTIGQWYYIALVWNAATGTDDQVWYAAAASSSMTGMTLTDSPDTLGTGWTFRIGNNAFNDSLNGRVANVRVYSAALTQAELEAEKPAAEPVRTADLYAWYPLDGTGDITDHSGNGRDLTATGTLTTESGPPVSAGGGSGVIAQEGSMLRFTIPQTNTGTVSSTITVPAGTDFVTVGVSQFHSVANYFSGGSMTFTKGGSQVAMTSASSAGDSSTGTWMASLWYLADPDIGTNKTLAWDWSGSATPDYPGVVTVFFWSGVDSVRDADGAQNFFLPYTTPTLTAVSGDTILAFAATYASGSEKAIATWTNLATLANVAFDVGDAAWGIGSPSGSTSVAAATGTFSDGGIVAIVMVPAAGAADPVYIAPSANITASGEATTAQLAPPTGKSAGGTGTIGYTTVGSNAVTTQSFFTNDGHHPGIPALTYTAVAGDIVTMFHAYGSSAGGGNIQVAVYETSGSTIGAMVGSPVTITFTSTAGWHTAAASIPLTAGTVYTVCYDFWTGTATVLYRQQSLSGTRRSQAAGTSLPDPWVESGTTPGESFSIYATVTNPGDFSVGRMWDDENGTDTVDI